MADINREQYNILDQFFRECVRFWEHELKTDSDVDRQPFIHAIAEIPSVYPYAPNGYKLDPETVKHFKKCRYMDCYGRDWEKYYTE